MDPTRLFLLACGTEKKAPTEHPSSRAVWLHTSPPLLSLLKPGRQAGPLEVMLHSGINTLQVSRKQKLTGAVFKAQTTNQPRHHARTGKSHSRNTAPDNVLLSRQHPGVGAEAGSDSTNTTTRIQVGLPSPTIPRAWREGSSQPVHSSSMPMGGRCW